MKAFKCLRTGLLFPSDYVEEWGTKYGIGLGPVPVSEALTNMYTQRKAVSGGKEMYPVGVCLAAIQEVDVTQEAFDLGKAVLMHEDHGMAIRGAIMRERQVAHSRVPA